MTWNIGEQFGIGVAECVVPYELALLGLYKIFKLYTVMPFMISPQGLFLCRTHYKLVASNGILTHNFCASLHDQRVSSCTFTLLLKTKMPLRRTAVTLCSKERLQTEFCMCYVGLSNPQRRRLGYVIGCWKVDTLILVLRDFFPLGKMRFFPVR